MRQAAANDLHEARREARSQVDAVRTQKEEEVRATRERAAAAALNARSLARSLAETRLTKQAAASEARLVADAETRLTELYKRRSRRIISSCARPRRARARV